MVSRRRGGLIALVAAMASGCFVEDVYAPLACTELAHRPDAIDITPGASTPTAVELTCEARLADLGNWTLYVAPSPAPIDLTADPIVNDTVTVHGMVYGNGGPGLRDVDVAAGSANVDFDVLLTIAWRFEASP